MPGTTAIGLDLAVFEGIRPAPAQFELRQASMKSKRNHLRFISSLAQAKQKLRREKLIAEADKPVLRPVSPPRLPPKPAS